MRDLARLAGAVTCAATVGAVGIVYVCWRLAERIDRGWAFA